MQRGHSLGSILQKMQGKQAKNYAAKSSNLQGVNCLCFPSQCRTDPQRGKKTVSQYQHRYGEPDAFDLCRRQYDWCCGRSWRPQTVWPKSKRASPFLLRILSQHIWFSGRSLGQFKTAPEHGKKFFNHRKKNLPFRLLWSVPQQNGSPPKIILAAAMPRMETIHPRI